MSPLTLKKSRASKRSVSKVSLDRRRQERMCSGDALATPHFAQTGKTLLPLMESIASLNKGGINSIPSLELAPNKFSFINQSVVKVSNSCYFYHSLRARKEESFRFGSGGKCRIAEVCRCINEVLFYYTEYCYKSLTVGVWCKQSNTQDNAE
ncbi:hypothetical protein AVEN_80808-1 [Araneus ventricosus]|uniref:Uncharacterized protein n=1 Tax=Araneus ventricosus TaxID=182803 RepID=A0A4Y2F2D5_ARAVE|nr:hypothetical protein AVEN_80808-1 [Araneus ventricosus]